MKTYRVYDKATRMYIGTIEIPTTENKDKYSDYILLEDENNEKETTITTNARRAFSLRFLIPKIYSRN